LESDNTLLAYFNNRKILITGSNGFVARNLIEELKTSDCIIHGIDISENANRNIEFHTCDLTDPKAFTAVLSEIEPHFIFHTAAIVTAERDSSLLSDMLKLHCETINNIFNALKESQELKLVVNFGTTEEYGDYNGKPFAEDMLERSLSPYAVTKTAGIHLACMLGKNDAFPVISVRPGVLFGRYQPETKFIPYIIKQLKNNDPLELSPCRQTRDFISVRSMIQILLELTASEKYTIGEVYNIASGRSWQLKEVVEMTKKALNSSSDIEYGALPYRRNEIMEFNVSTEKINALIDLSSIPPFEKDYAEFLKGF